MVSAGTRNAEATYDVGVRAGWQHRYSRTTLDRGIGVGAHGGAAPLHVPSAACQRVSAVGGTVIRGI